MPVAHSKEESQETDEADACHEFDLSRLIREASRLMIFTSPCP